MPQDDSELIRPDKSLDVPVQGIAKVVKSEQGDKTVEARQLNDKFVQLPTAFQPADLRRAAAIAESLRESEGLPDLPDEEIEPEIVFPEVTFEVLRVPEALARSPYERWAERLAAIKEKTVELQQELGGRVSEVARKKLKKVKS